MEIVFKTFVRNLFVFEVHLCSIFYISLFLSSQNIVEYVFTDVSV